MVRDHLGCSNYDTLEFSTSVGEIRKGSTKPLFLNSVGWTLADTDSDSQDTDSESHLGNNP